MGKEKLGPVRLLILDVDGVLSDGCILLSPQGEETYRFDVKDGQGIKLLLRAGIDVALVTGRSSPAVLVRARQLGIREVHRGVEDKGALCREIIRKKGLGKEEVCCVGDDLADLGVFRETGIPIAVADAVEEVLDAAVFVTERKGGRGAVREVCEWILKAQNRWQEVISTFRAERED